MIKLQINMSLKAFWYNIYNKNKEIKLIYNSKILIKNYNSLEKQKII